ncbi:hypothetical protein [Amphritea pacifica]|uniref:Uncharacterized protein n=1 Tax=Amphritea pacifica TaxID=2811233 RepID=A0ABS2WDD2_9GAMM|nr:hypothetical protein [Amphritea pacifica]MBN0989532.1 hypothetical protein [Amphritea pacifica]MBN1008361.1 hypothetical protein [Amphritea pacifica]
MQPHCRDCQFLIESKFDTEPHPGLKSLLKKPIAEIYQCRHCDSCFIFTRHDISLVVPDEPESKQC